MIDRSYVVKTTEKTKPMVAEVMLIIAFLNDSTNVNRKAADEVRRISALW